MELYIIVLLSILFVILGFIYNGKNKYQFVRILCILFYGPFLIWLSTYVKEEWVQIILLFIGLTIISYNIKNYEFGNNKNVNITHPASW